jgi:NADH:ubiquinone oxidoreductase subunit B-like Fe-S oxidoreductase
MTLPAFDRSDITTNRHGAPMKMPSARVVAGALFLLCAGTALAQVATCPGVVYDRYGTRKWTLAESHIKVSGGFSIFGISIIESEVTLVAVYVAEDGTRRSVDCRDIT